MKPDDTTDAGLRELAWKVFAAAQGQGHVDRPGDRAAEMSAAQGGVMATKKSQPRAGAHAAHSNMEHGLHTNEIKQSARKARRRADRCEADVLSELMHILEREPADELESN